MTFGTSGGPAGSGTKFPGLKPTREEWRCDCSPKLWPRYLLRCWTCGKERPR